MQAAIAIAINCSVNPPNEYSRVVRISLKRRKLQGQWSRNPPTEPEGTGTTTPREYFGFIFQRYHLLGDLCFGNAEVPAIYAGVDSQLLPTAFSPLN